MGTTPHRLGKYELLEHLGRGHVGDVWQARDPSLQRDVAVKVLYADLQQSDPHFLTRFATDGQKLVELHHANIVPLHEVAVARAEGGRETTAYLSMDYIEGPTLADYISSSSHRGLFPPVSEIVYLFTSLGVAIDYAHQQGVVHGNITPSNVLLNKHDTAHFPAGEPLLTDCGLEQLVGNAGTAATPHYISPEQARGYPANNRSDIYALGVMLYELCTGSVPFRDESSVAVMMQHMNALPTPPILINPNIPPALSEVILRAMAKDPATRFAMASLFAAAIADACSLQGPLSLGRQLPRIAAEADDETYSSHPSHPAMPSILGVSQPFVRPSAMGQFIAPAPSGSLAQPPAPVQQSPITGRPAVSSPLIGYAATSSQPLPEKTVSQPLTAAAASLLDSGKLAAQQALPPLPTPTQSTPTVRNPVFAQPTIEPVPVPVPVTPPAVRSISAPQPVPLRPPSPMLYAPPQPAPAAPAKSPLPDMLARSRFKHTDATVYILVASLILVVLVLGGVLASNALFHKSAAPTASVPGHVFFQDDALGFNDQLRIDLQNAPAPPDGKSYFAWLQDSTQQNRPLGALTVHDGNASLVYMGDAQHTNLLSIMQGIIITQEDTGATPKAPGTSIVYRARFDTAVLPYLKDILYVTPGLPGHQEGIAVMRDTIQSLNDKAGSIAETLHKDNPLVLRQATRIIEMLDGSALAGTSGDRPANRPQQLDIATGLFSTPTQQGYIDTVQSQLTQLRLVAGGNKSLLQHIDNLKNALDDVKTWLQNLRTYDVQLLKAADLNNPAIMDVALQIKQAAADSYNGRVIPPNQTPQLVLGSAGMIQAYSEAQYLASLDIQAL